MSWLQSRGMALADKIPDGEAFDCWFNIIAPVIPRWLYGCGWAGVVLLEDDAKPIPDNILELVSRDGIEKHFPDMDEATRALVTEKPEMLPAIIARQPKNKRVLYRLGKPTGTSDKPKQLLLVRTKGGFRLGSEKTIDMDFQWASFAKCISRHLAASGGSEMGVFYLLGSLDYFTKSEKDCPGLASKLSRF